MSGSQPHPTRPRGQILVIFALGVVAMLAMVGLVLDGGATFAQRREQQNVSDVAALAGANAYLISKDPAAAITKAHQIAAANGYTHGVGGVTVNVNLVNGASGSINVTVDVDKPHRNNFAGIVGLSEWDVTTTATAQSGFANTAVGAAPMIFSIDVFDVNGNALPQFSDPDQPFVWGVVNDNVPTQDTFRWTLYGSSAIAHYIGGNYDEAIRAAQTAVRLRPNFASAYRVLVAAAGISGQGPLAASALQELRRTHPDISREWIRTHVPLKLDTDMVHYLEGFRRAGLA